MKTRHGRSASAECNPGLRSAGMTDHAEMKMKEQPDVRTRVTAQFNQSLKLTGEDASSLALSLDL